MPKTKSSSKRKPATSDLSLDQAIKDLISDFPVDTWRFLLPEMAEKFGDPISWEILRSETRKTDYRKKGFVMDVPISYTFQGGESVTMVVLFEHWSTSKSVDILRTARYVLDLMVRFPDHHIIPVAVVTDSDPGKVSERLQLNDPMDSEPVLTFRHRVHKTAEEDLWNWRGKANVIAGGLFTLFKGELSKTEKAALGMDCLEKAGLSVEDEAKISTLLFRVGKLTEEEEREVMATRIKLPEAKIFTELRAEAKEQS
ncbi:MAG: hypothetical protein IPN71_13140 [Fibrobacteres bacterium]|nr:hypothetical protein [Fibrobacterota bacterium]